MYRTTEEKILLAWFTYNMTSNIFINVFYTYEFYLFCRFLWIKKNIWFTKHRTSKLCFMKFLVVIGAYDLKAPKGCVAPIFVNPSPGLPYPVGNAITSHDVNNSRHFTNGISTRESTTNNKRIRLIIYYSLVHTRDVLLARHNVTLRVINIVVRSRRLLLRLPAAGKYDFYLVSWTPAQSKRLEKFETVRAYCPRAKGRSRLKFIPGQ